MILTLPEKIALLLAWIAMSGTAGFEAIQQLLKAYRWINAHAEVSLFVFTILVTAYIIIGCYATIKAWRKA